MGRPSLSPDEDTVMLTVRAPRSWRSEIDQAAQRRGIKRTEWLRRVVLRGLEGERQSHPGVEPDPKPAKRTR